MNLPLPGQRNLALDRPVIMGVLNVTPDSFSDGGAYSDVAGAVEHAKQMLDQGADVIDVGGESTRPGAGRVTADEQIHRVVPVIRELCRQVPAAIVSVDTTLSSVGRAAMDVGAVMLNDVSAGRDDPAMFDLAAQTGVPIILMHMQGRPQTMQKDPTYENVVKEVTAFLLDRANVGMSMGIRRRQILIDPGIGFGKTVEHNLTLLAGLSQLVATGFPVLLGTSRKRCLSQVCLKTNGQTRLPRELAAATCATTALGVYHGVCVFRVHDVPENRQAADIAWAIANSLHNTSR